MAVAGESPLDNIRVDVACLEHAVGRKRFWTIEKETKVPRKSWHSFGKKAARYGACLSIENVIRIVFAHVQPAVIQGRRRGAAACASQIVVPNHRPIRGTEFINILTRAGNIQAVISDGR